MKKNNSSKQYFKAIYHKNRLQFGGSLILSLLGIPFNLFLAWILGAFTNAATYKNMNALINLLCCGLIVTAGYILTELLKEKFLSNYIKRGLQQYKALAFQNLSKKSIQAFTKENTGRYLSLLTNDVGSVEINYLNNLIDIVYYAILFIGSLGMMLWYSPLLTLISVVLCFLPLVVSVISRKFLIAKEKDVSAKNESFLAKLNDLLNGFSIIKSFKAEKEAIKLFEEANIGLESSKSKRRFCFGMITTASNTCGLLMQLGVFAFGGYLAILGDISSSTLIVFIQLCNYIILPVGVLPGLLASRKATKSLITKLAEVTDESTGRIGETIKPKLNKSIEFHKVNFGYDQEKLVLKNISLRLEAGKKYALVGASGSGKSTLLKLLMGAYDSYDGEITIDGKQLRNISTDSLYDLVSIVDQNVFVFDDTIERNITMFKEFPIELIKSSEERSGLLRVIEEKGSDYNCGENGVNLSGGERQRVSMARCLLRKTPVLLLDEATASLDNDTAFEITNSILSFDELTRVVVTHRLEKALLEQYDEIIVLHNGSICECGKFDKLMLQKSYFYSLYTIANG